MIAVHVKVNDDNLFGEQRRGHLCHCANCRKVAGGVYVFPYLAGPLQRCTADGVVGVWQDMKSHINDLRPAQIWCQLDHRGGESRVSQGTREYQEIRCTELRPPFPRSSSLSLWL